MRNFKNFTYNNVMAIAHRIHNEKHYDLQESTRLAKNILQNYLSNPLGLSVSARINQILTKEEWEQENRSNRL